VAEGDDFREGLRGALGEKLDLVCGVLDRALEAKRKVRVSRECVKCGCKHVEYVEVEDVDAAIKAAEFYSVHGFGRPGQAAGEEDGDRVVFQRLVELPADE
jgi:hypothetical protein